jgi:hypothetical protein
MSLRKYKYYFKKPKSEIIKDVLKFLATVGALCIAGTSPRFVPNLIKGYLRWRKYPKKRVSDTFYKLRKRGLIRFENRGGQIYIYLTEKGRKLAGLLQIDELKIKKPKKWDKKWRILIFDISQLKKIYREALRGKLKELGFYQLQKSVWIHPYDCRAEVEILKEFFGLSDKELRLIEATNIGNDKEIKRFFKL